MTQLAEINHSAVDRFTFAHAGVGLFYGLIKMPWWGALGLGIAWEVVERPLKDRWPQAFPHASQDTWANMIFDVLAVMVGWVGGRLIRRIT